MLNSLLVTLQILLVLSVKHWSSNNLTLNWLSIISNCLFSLYCSFSFTYPAPNSSAQKRVSISIQGDSSIFEEDMALRNGLKVMRVKTVKISKKTHPTGYFSLLLPSIERWIYHILQGDPKFSVMQAFPAAISAEEADPFLMCDHFGPTVSEGNFENK